MKDEEDDHILDLEPPKHKFGFFFTISLVTVFILLLFLSLSNFNISTFTFEWSEQDKTSFSIFVVSVFIGLIGNILATIIWAKYLEGHFKSQQKNKLLKIKSFAHPELIQDVFKDLRYYDNRYCSNYIIETKLTKHPTLDLLVCNVKYSYDKVFKNNKLVFKFIRIRNDEQVTDIEINETQLADSYLENEFYYQFDERSYPELNEQTDLYKLTYLQVVIDGKPTRLRPLEKKDPHFVEYSTTFENNPSSYPKAITITYEVQYVIEKESHLFFTIELPTKNIVCEFDYSEVKDILDLYGYDFISSHRGPTLLHVKDESKIRLIKSDWVLPKSSFMFIWYKK